MKPIQSSPTVKNRPRRRADLSLPLPHRHVSLAGGSKPSSSGPASSADSSNNSSKAMSFSDLEIGNRIGRGASGTVYKVVHRPTSQLYALKVIYGNHDETVRRRICKEIEILQDVNHKNVVKWHEMFDQNGEIQILVELMDKGSLEGVHVCSEHQLSDISHQILNGLAYLHSRHFVHGDIRPSNLLINSAKNVKIADFGLSRTMDACNLSIRTVAYMSPERINTDLNLGQYDGYAGDIWSFGLSILEFYLGKFPFPVSSQGDWASLMCAICMSQPPQPPASATPEFRDFISCCLQRDPTKRLSAIELLQHPFIHKRNLRQVVPPPLPPFRLSSASSSSPTT